MAKPIRLAVRHVKDPARYPKVTIPIENIPKRIYKSEIRKTLIEVTKKMTDFVKKD